MTRVLVVDDEDDNLFLLTELLLDRGYEILSAVNGQSALEIARAENPDVIIMDGRMPGMTGYEATRELKRDGRTKAIPVIFLSGDTGPEDRKRAFDAGANDFHARPPQLDPLCQQIETLLTRRETT